MDGGRVRGESGTAEHAKRAKNGYLVDGLNIMTKRVAGGSTETRVTVYVNGDPGVRSLSASAIDQRAKSAKVIEL